MPDRVSVEAVCRRFLLAAPVDGAAFTQMTSDTVRETLCASDALIAELQQIQYSLGEGPTHDAFALRRPVLLPDLAGRYAARRWPMFATEAARFRIGSLFAFPMHVGAITVGVCEVYRIRVGPLTPAELNLVLLAVDEATLALLVERSTLSLDQSSSEPRAGPYPGSRPVHQATGMLIAQLGVSAEEAFARLRAHAYSEGRDIHDVADDVVRRRIRLELDPK